MHAGKGTPTAISADIVRISLLKTQSTHSVMNIMSCQALNATTAVVRRDLCHLEDCVCLRMHCSCPGVLLADGQAIPRDDGLSSAHPPVAWTWSNALRRWRSLLSLLLDEPPSFRASYGHPANLRTRKQLPYKRAIRQGGCLSILTAEGRWTTMSARKEGLRYLLEFRRSLLERSHDA